MRPTVSQFANLFPSAQCFSKNWVSHFSNLWIENAQIGLGHWITLWYFQKSAHCMQSQSLQTWWSVHLYCFSSLHTKHGPNGTQLGQTFPQDTMHSEQHLCFLHPIWKGRLHTWHRTRIIDDAFRELLSIMRYEFGTIVIPKWPKLQFGHCIPRKLPSARKKERRKRSVSSITELKASNVTETCSSMKKSDKSRFPCTQPVIS